jgi:hypothetical protein
MKMEYSHSDELGPRDSKSKISNNKRNSGKLETILSNTESEDENTDNEMCSSNKD